MTRLGRSGVAALVPCQLHSGCRVLRSAPTPTVSSTLVGSSCRCRHRWSARARPSKCSASTSRGASTCPGRSAAITTPLGQSTAYWTTRGLPAQREGPVQHVDPCGHPSGAVPLRRCDLVMALETTPSSPVTIIGAPVGPVRPPASAATVTRPLQILNAQLGGNGPWYTWFGVWRTAP